MTEAQELYYGGFKQGRYSGLYMASKKLYELFLLAVEESDRDELCVNFTAKPNEVMLYVRVFKISGIKFETFMCTEEGSFINVGYRARINPMNFLFNLNKFDRITDIEIVNTVNKKRMAEKADKRRKEIAAIKAKGCVNTCYPGAIGKIPIIR